MRCVTKTCIVSKASSKRSFDSRAILGKQVRSKRRVWLSVWSLATVWNWESKLRAEESIDFQAIVPKRYKQDTLELVEKLRESIELEANGGLEREVRRKAEPVQRLIKEFLGSWNEEDSVVTDPSYREISTALETLGKYYRSQGPRSPLDEETRKEVLERLSTAEEALERLQVRGDVGWKSILAF